MIRIDAISIPSPARSHPRVFAEIWIRKIQGEKWGAVLKDVTNFATSSLMLAYLFLRRRFCSIWIQPFRTIPSYHFVCICIEIL